MGVSLFALVYQLNMNSFTKIGKNKSVRNGYIMATHYLLTDYYQFNALNRVCSCSFVVVRFYFCRANVKINWNQYALYSQTECDDLPIRRWQFSRVCRYVYNYRFIGLGSLRCDYSFVAVWPLRRVVFVVYSATTTTAAHSSSAHKR